jgi:hypothetical protein
VAVNIESGCLLNKKITYALALRGLKKHPVSQVLVKGAA